MLLLEAPPQSPDLEFAQFGRKHLPRPVHQVVGLVDEKGVRPAFLQEETLEIGARVEHIVVVADDDIGPQRHIQRQLKRADPMLARHLLDLGPGDGVVLE